MDLKPATHLAFLYVDRGEFNRPRLTRTHLAIFFFFLPIVAMWQFRKVM